MPLRSALLARRIRGRSLRARRQRVARQHFDSRTVCSTCATRCASPSTSSGSASCGARSHTKWLAAAALGPPARARTAARQLHRLQHGLDELHDAEGHKLERQLTRLQRARGQHIGHDAQQQRARRAHGGEEEARAVLAAGAALRLGHAAPLLQQRSAQQHAGARVAQVVRQRDAEAASKAAAQLMSNR